MRLRIVENKGIHIIHDDGPVFSIQLGPGNYCENKDMDFDFPKNNQAESRDCEVAVFSNDEASGEWITSEYFKESDGLAVGGIAIRDALRIAIHNEKLNKEVTK